MYNFIVPGVAFAVVSSPATYQVTAVRSTSRGNPSQFTVSFGSGGPGAIGMTITSVTEDGPVKLAA